MSKILWYRAADKNSPFGIWKNLCPDMEEKAIILRNSQTGKIRCPVHCEWEDYSVIDEFNVKCSCGKEAHGLVIPWVPEKGLTKKPQNSGVLILTDKNRDWRRNEKYRIEQLNIKEKIAPCDEEGVSFDNYLFALETDLDECTVFFRSRTIDRMTFRTKKNLKVPEFHWACSAYFKGRKSKGRDGSAKIIYNAFELPKHSKQGLKLPEIINQELEAVTEKLVQTYVGKKILVNKDLYHGLDLLMAAANFPYEVNVTDAAKRMGFLDSIKTENPWLERDNPNVFNALCEKLDLPIFTEFRKLFDLNPLVLVWYKHLHDMGFRDINIISDILKLFYKSYNSREYEEYKQLSQRWAPFEQRKEIMQKLPTIFFIYLNKYDVFKENENSFIFFCEHSIELRGERATWRALNRGKDLDYQEREDIAKMFRRYYFDLKPEEKKMVLKQGFTKQVHDTLSKIVNNLKNKNFVFTYTEAQKLLEDEIDGYRFLLPPDSYTMHTVGSAMHNCVFSYWERVLEGACTIVYAMLNDEYKACIEINDKRAIIQARSDYNGPLDEETLKVFKKWVKKNTLLYFEFY